MTSTIYVTEEEFNKIEGQVITDLQSNKVKLVQGFRVQMQKGTISELTSDVS